MINITDMYLVILEESINKVKNLMTHTRINDLLYELCGKVFFGTRIVQIKKICVNMDGALSL